MKQVGRNYDTCSLQKFVLLYLCYVMWFALKTNKTESRGGHVFKNTTSPVLSLMAVLHQSRGTPGRPMALIGTGMWMCFEAHNDRNTG